MKRGRSVIVVLAALLGIAWLGHPVCVAIPDEDLKLFHPVAIEQRSDHDLFLFRTFQKQNGHWCQCKNWLARQMFF